MLIWQLGFAVFNAVGPADQTERALGQQHADAIFRPLSLESRMFTMLRCVGSRRVD